MNILPTSTVMRNIFTELQLVPQDFQGLACRDRLLQRVVVFVTIIEKVRKAFHKLRDNLVGTDLKDNSYVNYI